jgi:hypothetical protein
MARYGTPIRCSVTGEVAEAIMAESKRIKRTMEHTASELLAQWYEDVYLPWKKKQEEK